MQEVFYILKEIAQEIQALLIKSDTNYIESNNASGDQQLQVDVMADQIIEKKLLSLDSIRGICSEEKEKAILKENGDYLIAYDPLDGSSLFDSNLSIGSIFGIYTQKFDAKYLKASAYIIYGPRLEIVFGDNKITHLSFDGKNWREKTPISLKEKGKINATGGTQKNWSSSHKAFIQSLFDEGYRLRYSGGMVPDLHQILIKGGGLFSYPSTSDAKDGKLRKLFEVFPFAHLFELCGGEATDGKQRLLDLPCNNLHETTPCYFGSKQEIYKLKSFFKEN